MIRKNLLVSFLVSAIFSWQSLAQNIDELVGGHLEASGGVAKLKALKSLKVSGKLVMPMMTQNASAGGSATEAPVIIQIKKPNLVRMEIDLQGKQLVQAFDGETAWSLRPGSKEPDILSWDEGGMGEMADLFLREIADLEGPLVDSKNKWNKVELLGKENVEGTESYKLKLSPKDGFVRYLFLDAKGLLTTKLTRPGSEFLMETYYKDYKPVNGLMMPYTIESRVDGNTFSKLTLEKAEPDVAVDDALFKMPGSPPQN
jgi:outer membrane lipoprotein-sorting protein